MGVEAGVYLTITQEDVDSLIFVVPKPAEIPMGYTSELQTGKQPKLTHPWTHYWKGGRIKDLPIRLHMVAGLSPFIPNADILATKIQSLFDMALPSLKISQARRYLDPVLVQISANGRAWFQMKGLLQDITVNWGEPIDMDSGRPCSAEVNLVFVPTFTPPNQSLTATDALLPKRPFRFDKLYGIPKVPTARPVDKGGDKPSDWWESNIQQSVAIAVAWPGFGG